MRDRLRFLLSRLRERLWIKPLIACVLSVAGVLLAHLADRMAADASLPEVSQDSVIELLKVIAASMLGIATFAVASMVSAYASAGQMATARAFPLIVADDVSQNALSTFVGAFIFSIVGLSAAMNGYYGPAGRFTLFVLMTVVLIIVILTFVRWVDRIARLGRVGAIIAKVEQAAAAALARRRRAPHLGGTPPSGAPHGEPVYRGERDLLHTGRHAAAGHLAPMQQQAAGTRDGGVEPEQGRVFGAHAEQALGRRRPHHVMPLGGREEGRQRHQRHPGFAGGQVGGDPVRAVVGEHGDGGMRPEPGAQHLRDVSHALRQVRSTPRPVGAGKHRYVACAVSEPVAHGRIRCCRT